MSQLPVWGIDVTATSLRAVLLAPGEGGRPRAEAWDVIDFAEDVEDVRGVGRYDAMARAVRRFVKHQDVRNAKVVASMRGETAFVRTVVTPRLKDDGFEKMLAHEAQQQIPFPLEEVYWDRRVAGLSDEDAIVSLYAVRRQQVDDRLRRLGLMGLPVDALQLRPIALQNFCAAEKLLDEGAVVVDYDYSGMQILVAHEDRTWFRCLPLGGADFVERLVSRFKLPHAVAVRTAAGQTPPRPGAAAAFSDLRTAVAREAAAEAAAQVRSYVAAHPGVRLSKLVLFSSHPACPPLGAALAEAMRLKPYEPRGFKSIDVASDLVAAGLQENFSGLARAVGLALQGLGMADTAVRLYPETIPRAFRRGRTGYVAAGFLLAGAVFLATARHAEVRAGFADGLRDVESRLASAEKNPRDKAMRRAEEGDPLPRAEAVWAARGADRNGRLELYSALLSSVAADEAGPRIVAFEAGEIPGRAARAKGGRLVLAATENAAPDELDRRMDAFVAAMVGKHGLKIATATDGWSAASPEARKPASPDERLLRFRFRHREYDLGFEGSP